MHPLSYGGKTQNITVHNVIGNRWRKYTVIQQGIKTLNRYNTVNYDGNRDTTENFKFNR